MKAINSRDTIYTGSTKKNPFSYVNMKTDSSLLTEMQQAKAQIDTILLRLDYQTDPDLIDSCTYELKGAYMRYRFLLKQAQQQAMP